MAGLTSSTSLISFRARRKSRKPLTSGPPAASYWFMLEPLLMSKFHFRRGLPKKSSRISFWPSAPELEALRKEGARQDDDIEVAKVYEKGWRQGQPA